jgi:two-component sensor histidine kinase
MANRKPQMTSNKATSTARRANRLTTKELLRYLVKPLHLPHFDFSTFASEHFLVQTIRKLLTEAIIDQILPTKVIGVQFIFAKRSNSIRRKVDDDVRGNFSFPLLLCCKNREKAVEISDGMAYVTDLLMRKQSSFHLRIRKFKLTHSPAVCVYSTSGREEQAEFDSTNVLWVNLPASGHVADQLTFPDKNLRKLDKYFDGRSFYHADLGRAIDGGYYEEEKDFPTNFTPSNSGVRILGESHLSVDVRRDRLEELQEDLAQDEDYLKRVSYLLNFGDVILCTPHAYDIRSSTGDGNINTHETITDAGLTVITDREKGLITEDDWLRVQAVAQKLAIFAGAAASTAAEARGGIMETLNNAFAHEFSNASTTIVAHLESIRRSKNALSSADVKDIEGRLQFTQTLMDSAMWFYKGSTGALSSILAALMNPMQKYQDLLINEIDYTSLAQYEVASLWQLVLAEALRNAYKHCLVDDKDKTKHIQVVVHGDKNHVTVAVKNRATREFILDPDREGWAFMQRVASSLSGTVSPIEDNNLFSVNVRMPLTAKGVGMYV